MAQPVSQPAVYANGLSDSTLNFYLWNLAAFNFVCLCNRFSYYYILVLRLNLHHMFSYITYFDIPCNALLRLVCSDVRVLVAGLVM
jgi:hypothetical protein